MKNLALKKQKRHEKEDSPCSSRTLRALTEAQGHYILAIKSKTITFGVGPAGTGKTFIAAALACDEFANNAVNKIIITRPVVEAGNSLGALPGPLQDKFAPYIAPIYEAMQQRLGKSQIEYAFKAKQIQAIPMEFLRGHSFDDAWILLDEAQNSTPEQMLMLLTRIGKNTRLIINGDPKQSDIRRKSGLDDALEKLQGLKDVGIVDFDLCDIVRSGIVRTVLLRYAE